LRTTGVGCAKRDGVEKATNKTLARTELKRIMVHLKRKEKQTGK